MGRFQSLLILLALIVCSYGLAVAQPASMARGWQPFGPSPMGSHAMAYDSGRGVVVLFGGMSAAGYLPDTWEWDGTTWTLRASLDPRQGSARDGLRRRARPCRALRRPAPRPLRRHLGVGRHDLDPAGLLRTLARGSATRWPTTPRVAASCSSAATATAVLSDTWEWDGTAWTEQASSPAYAESWPCVMAYDSARERRCALRRRRASAGDLRTPGSGMARRWTQRGLRRRHARALAHRQWPTTPRGGGW